MLGHAQEYFVHFAPVGQHLMRDLILAVQRFGERLSGARAPDRGAGLRGIEPTEGVGRGLEEVLTRLQRLRGEGANFPGIFRIPSWQTPARGERDDTQEGR
eukprot:7081464-Lingulodinium_polyedra.AAC.1